MELRNTEQEVTDMLIVYESLRRYEAASSSLPALELLPQSAKETILENSATAFVSYSTDEDVLKELESLRTKFDDLEPRIKKFRQRLEEKDPITGDSRYGPKSVLRVQNVLALHSVLKKATWAAFGLNVEAEEEEKKVEASGNSAVANLRSAVEAKQEAKRQAELEQQQQSQAADAAKQAEEEQRRLELERQSLQAEESRQREEADLARRANEAREATRREQEAAAQAERDWIDSIPKGPEGVRKQISILKEDTKEDPSAQSTALKSLLTIFTQIAQHPEDINFRRIRRDHPQFHQDVGRHKGGREILIAAGFKLTTLDDVPVFFSKEPDLESDMDGWSGWFDNLKANLEVVKAMQ